MNTQDSDVGMSPEQMQAALSALREEQVTKGGLTYRERRACLKALLKSLRGHREDLVAAVDADFGSRAAVETYLAECYPVVTAIKHALAELSEWMAPRSRSVQWPFLPATAEVVYQPLGVVGVIAPWNYPVTTSLGPIVAAISAGNRVLLKPSEETPRTTAVLTKILEQGIGTDIVRVIPGGVETGKAFSRLPFDHILFTGSTEVGRKVMEAASGNLTPVTLELGGKSPVLIHPSYSLNTAAKRIAYGKLLNAGQTCLAPDHVYVDAGRVDEFCEVFRGVVSRYYPSLEGNAQYSSIINERHYRRLSALLEECEEAGAKVIRIMPEDEELVADNRKFPPTLVIGATREMRIMQEEIFGPILPVLPYTDVDRVIAEINRGPKPLSVYYFDHKESRINDVIAKTDSGGVSINETLVHYAVESLPFGGVGESGMGSCHGYAGFRTFSNERSVFRQARLHGLQLLAPPYRGFARWIARFLT